MLTLTQTKVIKIRDRFFNQVAALPVKVNVLVEAFAAGADDVEDGYTKMLRTSDETFTSTKVDCLYTREITPKLRTKYGLDESIVAIIYVSPTELEAKLGTWKPNYKKMIIRFTDFDTDAFYEIDSAVYLEPLYNTCIAVRYHLSSTTKQIDVNSITELQKLVVL